MSTHTQDAIRPYSRPRRRLAAGYRKLCLSLIWPLAMMAATARASDEETELQDSAVEDGLAPSAETLPFFPDDTLCDCREEIAQHAGLSAPIVVQLERECPPPENDDEDFETTEPRAALCAEVFALLTLREEPSGSSDHRVQAMAGPRSRRWFRGLSLRLDIRALFAVQSRGQLGDSLSFQRAGDSFFFATISVEILR